ncbi:glutathione S-transferase family protein [Novosphingobium lentum]|uniref:glutathione S-transferase family protein n=1 Tax=Novosphingobium lentum TaxID=145287 RepID=UPI0008302EA0|nr:glutathione S-transferase family protein [Novosphingobium lentum]
MTITIYQLDRSRSERAVWLMEELGAAYDIEFFERLPVTMQAEPAYKALHPLGSSPVLGIDGTNIAESGAVIEYLATTQGGGALALGPTSPDYADYLYWFHFAESTMMPALVSEIMAGFAGIDPENQLRVYARQRIAQLLAFTDARLAAVPFFAGEQFTAADVMMTFPFTMTRQYVPVDVEGHPAIAAYVERMEARPAYQRCRAIVDRAPKGNA